MGEKTGLRQVIVHETSHCNENTWDSVVTEEHYSLSVKRDQSHCPLISASEKQIWQWGGGGEDGLTHNTGLGFFEEPGA